MTNHTTSNSFTLSGLKRPDVITNHNQQRAILVRDASVSMDDEGKALEASKASQNFVAELAKPENKDGFYVAVIDYSERAAIVNPFAKATELKGHLEQISTISGTNITAGLARARRLLEETPDKIDGKEQFLKPVVVLFTDGCHNTGQPPHDEAQKLKKVADVVTAAFGSDADLDLLREIANSPEHCYRCQDGHDLRAFMAAVGTTLSHSIRAGEDATKPLSEIKQ